MSAETIVSLEKGFFAENEKTFATNGELSASLFRFDTGVEAVRLKNARGECTLLPFQGQQVWDAVFDGRILTMKSMFSRPFPTTDYMATYGGFIIHCGATAMGVPSAGDTHAIHGELPNARYQKAFLHFGADERGEYLGVSGEFQYTIAFNHNYVARPIVTLRPGRTLLELSMSVTNLKRTDMELMYMAHVNFRPVDDGRLVYSAPCKPDSVRVRTVIPSHIHPPKGYTEFLKELERDPAKHNRLSPGLAFDPEVVLYLSYLADEQGWAHSMMVHPDGLASYIRHRPDQLDHGVRWISRTRDQDCFGLLLPSTAEPEGYTAEKAKGNVKVLPAGKTVRFDVAAGLLGVEEARKMEKEIERILG
jgi:hypothetical protein